jgi:hypothetical protein
LSSHEASRFFFSFGALHCVLRWFSLFFSETSLSEPAQSFDSFGLASFGIPKLSK